MNKAPSLTRLTGQDSCRQTGHVNCRRTQDVFDTLDAEAATDDEETR